MSFRAFALLALICFGAFFGVSAAGFCAQLTQSTPAPLSNGANSALIGTGTWSTGNLGGFTDGQFQNDGGYIVPVQGVYHFDATLQVSVATVASPDQSVDLRIVKCAGGCNALCTGSTSVGATLIQSAELYLAAGFTGAFPPTYSLSASFTGFFNTGDLIALCVDNQATAGAVKLVCPSNTQSCIFSGFSA